MLKDSLRLTGGSWGPVPYKKGSESKETQIFYFNGFTGWIHPLAEPGDQIYLLKGCSTPVILRLSYEKHPERGLTYRVIGDAYVVSAMHSEAWTDNDEELEDIYLV